MLSVIVYACINKMGHRDFSLEINGKDWKRKSNNVGVNPLQNHKLWVKR